jgi:transcriptional regulator with XRE-family HTH domain
MKTDLKEYSSSILDDLFNEADESVLKKINSKMELAAAIDDAIKSKGWNKIKFAEIIKQKPSVITKWLSGTHNFTVDTLIDIGIILNVDLFNINKVSNNIKAQQFVIEINTSNIDKCIEDACFKFTASSMTTSSTKTIQSISKKFSVLNS